MTEAYLIIMEKGKGYEVIGPAIHSTNILERTAIYNHGNDAQIKLELNANIQDGDRALLSGNGTGRERGTSFIEGIDVPSPGLVTREIARLGLKVFAAHGFSRKTLMNSLQETTKSNAELEDTLKSMRRAE